MAGKIRPCVHCGDLFRPEFPRGGARTCSPECSTARSRQIHVNAVTRYNERHKDAVQDRWRRYSRTHREVKNKSWNDWMARNREHRNAKARERYAEKKAAP